MFGSILGCAGSQGTAGNNKSLVSFDTVMFDDAEAAADFTNQLKPQQKPNNWGY
jgi:hypothetical protein